MLEAITLFGEKKMQVPSILSRLVLIIAILITGCAAPEAVRKKASTILNDKCLELFAGGGNRSYQHFTQAMDGGDKSTSFALVIGSDGRQACGWAHHGEVKNARGCEMFCKDIYTHEEIDAMALKRCEDYKQSANIDNNCKIYARENNIVWGKEDSKNLDFE